MTLREMLRIPFVDFPNVIKFRNDPLYGVIIAKIDGEPIGRCGDHSENGIAAWKAEVFKRLAHFSTTIELRTLCGCVQTIDTDQERHYRVPLMIRPSMLACKKDDDTFPESATFRTRDFEFRGRLSSDGLRCFEERE
jgi:hypothetical protein